MSPLPQPAPIPALQPIPARPSQPAPAQPGLAPTTNFFLWYHFFPGHTRIFPHVREQGKKSVQKEKTHLLCHSTHRMLC